MLKLGATKKKAAVSRTRAPEKAKQKRGAPDKAKRGNYLAPPPVGFKFRCGDCGEKHILVPCSNRDPEYEDWRFYYCGYGLKLACMNGYAFCELKPVEKPHETDDRRGPGSLDPKDPRRGGGRRRGG